MAESVVSVWKNRLPSVSAEKQGVSADALAK